MKPVTEPILRAAANAFDFGGPVVCDARHYGEGHINDTFVVWREDHAKRFILQRINTDTFTDPVGLMENVCGVTRHLREKILAAGGDPARETLNVIPHPVRCGLPSGCRGQRVACLRLCRGHHLPAAGGQRGRLPHCCRDPGQIPEPAGRLSGLHPPRNHCPLPRHAQPLCKLCKKPLPPMRWAVPRTLHRRSHSSMRGKRIAMPCWICWQPVRFRCVSPTTTPRSTTS